MQIHRLVWIVFNDLIPTGFELNHIDCDNKNSSLDNLELVSHSENMKHAVKNGLLDNSLFKPNNKEWLKMKRYTSIA